MIVRALVPADWQQFRDIRLHALQSCPGAYSTSYADAKDRTEAQWKDLIAGADRHVFGLFNGTDLAGIAAVFAEGTTATFAMAFIRPEYRGRSLSHLLFDARMAWCREHNIDRAIVSHRASNEASARAIRRHGFSATSRAVRLWPDGETEDEISSELRLDP